MARSKENKRHKNNGNSCTYLNQFKVLIVPDFMFAVYFVFLSSKNIKKIEFLLSRHPLFSLLALLLEKCEQATQGYIPSNSPNSSSTSSPNGSTNNNENDSFSRDIQVSLITIYNFLSVHAFNFF